MQRTAVALGAPRFTIPRASAGGYTIASVTEVQPVLAAAGEFLATKSLAGA